MNEFKHNGSKSFNTYCFEIIPVKAFTFDLRGLYILHIVRVTMTRCNDRAYRGLHFFLGYIYMF